MARDRQRRSSTYADLIRAVRKWRGLTQDELAHKLKRSRKFIAGIENEFKVPLERQRLELEKELKIKPSISRRIIFDISPNMEDLPDIIDLSIPEDKLEVVQITRSVDQEFEQFLKLLKATFPDSDMRATDQDFKRWLDEASVYLSSPIPCENIYLVTKSVLYDKVVALLFASHYPSTGFMFIDYLAVDTAFAKEAGRRGQYKLSKHVSTRAIPLILSRLAAITPRVRGVLAEIARVEEMRSRKIRFRRYAKNIFDAEIYAIGAAYKTPDADVTKDHTDIEYDLVFFPGPQERSRIDVNDPKLTKSNALEIFSFVYNQAYGDSDLNTKGEADYRTYSERLFAELAQELPEWVPLTPLR
jgi:transcriptional regulator with XRE-family HTH domain